MANVTPDLDHVKIHEIRMMKYRIGNETYHIGSTIIDRNITISDYAEAYALAGGMKNFIRH